MKKSIFLIPLFTILLCVNVNAQNLKKEREFFKATTYLLVTFDLFDSVNKQDISKQEASSLIEKNLVSINNSYNVLKPSFENDIDFKNFELWVQGVNRYLDLMKEDDPSYVLGVYLMRLDINDFINIKL